MNSPLVSCTHAAMRLFIEKRSVMVGAVSNGDIVQTGSGTCITIGDRFFVATAAHVVMGHSPEQIFVVNGRAEEEPNLGIATALGLRGGVEEDKLDLAWLEVNPARLSNKVFATLNEIERGVSHELDSWFLATGFPGEEIHIDYEVHTFGGTPVTRSTTSVDPSAWPARTDESGEEILLWDTDHDFVLSYSYLKEDNTTETGSPQRSIRAEGLSGGGAWIGNQVGDELWSSNPKLIGIVRTWRFYEGLLRCTLIEDWLQMLCEDVPDIRESIGGCK